MKFCILALLDSEFDPYWADIEKGVNTAAKKYNITAYYFSPPIISLPGEKEDIIKKWQNEKIEEAITKKVDGIAIAPLSEEAIKDTINKAVAANIPCITYDNDAPNTHRDFYVGTNNYLAGKIAANNLASLINFQGKIVIFTPSLTANSCLERIRGFREAIAKFNNIEISDIISGDEDPNKILTYPNQILQQYSDVVAIFCVNGICGISVARAIRDNKKTGIIKVICFDALPDVVYSLKEKVIQIVIAQRPYDIGYRIVELLYRIVKYGKETTLLSIPATKIIDTGVDVMK